MMQRMLQSRVTAPSLDCFQLGVQILYSSASMAAESHARTLYRAILRELPPRSSAAAPSPIRSSIRQHFARPAFNVSPEYKLARRQEAEQFVQFLKAQRVYGELLERYNPGMNMDDEERVRLSARRVGMEMPVEWKTGNK